MFTKAIAKALVIVLTVGMTSLIGGSSSAVTFSDTLILSSATMSQQVGETLTSGSVVTTVAFLSGALGDTFAVTSSLVSAPAGNTKLPILELFETTSAEVYSGSSPNRLNLKSEIQAGVQARISPLGNPPVAVFAKFHLYMDAPTKMGTYVVKITPAVVGGGGVLSTSAQTLTITVSAAPRIFADVLTLSAATMSQDVGETSSASSAVISASYLSTGYGDTYSVTTSLVSAPAGNTSLPKLRLVETTGAAIRTSGSADLLSINSVIEANVPAMITPSSGGPTVVAAKFQVYIDNPNRAGTYVVKVTPSIASNNVINSSALTLTITVGGVSSTPEPPSSESISVPPLETSTPDTYTVSIRISAAVASQLTNKSRTTSDLFVTLKAFANNYGDTFSVSSYLVSAPAGNTSLPILELVGSVSSDTSSSISVPQPGGFGGYAVVDPRDNHVCGVTVSASNDPFNNGGFIGNEYMGCPANSRFVFQTFPSDSGNVAGWHGVDVILNGSTYSLPGGRTLTNGIVTDPDGRRWHSGTGATISPATVLTASQTSNVRVTDALTGGNIVGNGESVTTQSAFITPLLAPESMTAVFRLALNKPKKAGTYVIKLLPQVVGGSGTAPAKGLTITLTVTRDPDTYPSRADVTLSKPGEIANKSDAEIYAPVTFDASTEVAVIRTTMKTALGQTTLEDFYLATISGAGVLGSAPLSTNINTVASGRTIQVRAGDVVTVYGDGMAGVGTITISNYDGTVVGRKTVNFVDLSNQASAILGLSFSSFPEKGSLVTLTGLVNLPGTVRFTTNGKTLGSCARIAATGSPKTAVCQWKPPISGSVNIVARFTPADQAISAVTTTKVLAIGRRSGKR